MDQPSISLTRQQDFIGSREIREFFMRGSRRGRGGKERKRKNKKKRNRNKATIEKERKKEGRKKGKSRKQSKREERNRYVITKRRDRETNRIRDKEREKERERRRKKGEDYFAQVREKETAWSIDDVQPTTELRQNGNGRGRREKEREREYEATLGVDFNWKRLHEGTTCTSCTATNRGTVCTRIKPHLQRTGDGIALT